ncbi:hypothetical protein V6N13_065718 [Hibiscus sabdariffa]
MENKGNEEPIGEGASNSNTVSVSDYPQLWIHEKSGLLLPVFRNQRKRNLLYLKAVDATILGIKNSLDVSEDSEGNCDYETKCRERCRYTDTTAAAMGERIQRTALNISNNENVDGSGSRFSEEPIEERKINASLRASSILCSS